MANTISGILGLIAGVTFALLFLKVWDFPDIPDSLDEYFSKEINNEFLDLNYRNISVNNIYLTVATCGSEKGALLLFLHGFPETGRTSWGHQLRYFCSKGYFVLAPDQRGYNTSYKGKSLAEYDLDFLANDAIGLIKHFNKSTAYIVSHDWGAAVGWWLGINYPEYVKKLVIINVPHLLAFTEHLKTSLTQLRKSWYMFFFQVPLLPELYIKRENFLRLESTMVRSLPNVLSKQEVESYKQAWGVPGALTGMLNWYRQSISGKKQKISELSRVKVKTLIIWGIFDTALDPMGPQSLEYCDDGHLEELEASHFVQHEKPKEVNQLIHKFITEK